MISHPIAPFCPESAQILVLGSFPSVASREMGFYYGHRQNRFWRVLASLYNCSLPSTVEEKQRLLSDMGIAVWDVIASCEITGSADNSIRSVIPNDIGLILETLPIERIFVNGKTAEKYYNRYIKDRVGRKAILLPSTSPANAAWELDRLIEAWRAITNR